MWRSRAPGSSAATASRTFLRRASRTTRQFSAAKRLAAHRPIPEEAPVMITVFMRSSSNFFKDTESLIRRD